MEYEQILQKLEDLRQITIKRMKMGLILIVPLAGIGFLIYNAVGLALGIILGIIILIFS